MSVLIALLNYCVIRNLRSVELKRNNGYQYVLCFVSMTSSALASYAFLKMGRIFLHEDRTLDAIPIEQNAETE